MVEALPSEFTVTPRPTSSLFVPSSRARALEILVAVALMPAEVGRRGAAAAASLYLFQEAYLDMKVISVVGTR
jgi:hypothetical protein